MKKKIAALVLCLTCITALCGCSGDKSTSTIDLSKDETYTWHFAVEEYENSVQETYAKEFAKKINKKSNGKIKIDVYTVGQIGDATQHCELLQNKGVEFAIVSPGNIGTIVPENQLCSLHFLFSDDMKINERIFNESKALNEDLNKKYLEKKIKVLDWWTEGVMEWTANKPLRSPKDFKGLKIRTMPSNMIIAAYEAYGANPTPMPYAEVYSGLQLNMVEGQENPDFGINESKFYEVQDYLTQAASNLYITTTCVNPKFYDELPDDVRKIVDETVEEMRPRSFEIQQEINDAALKNMQKKSDIKVIKLTDKERDSFRPSAKKAYKKYKKLVGKDGAKILDKLIVEIEQIEKEEMAKKK